MISICEYEIFLLCSAINTFKPYDINLFLEKNNDVLGACILGNILKASPLIVKHAINKTVIAGRRSN